MLGSPFLNPKENILIYNVKQCWAPLRIFLGVEVPAVVDLQRVDEGQPVLTKVSSKQAALRRRMQRIFAAMILIIMSLILLARDKNDH